MPEGRIFKPFSLQLKWINSFPIFSNIGSYYGLPLIQTLCHCIDPVLKYVSTNIFLNLLNYIEVGIYKKFFNKYFY